MNNPLPLPMNRREVLQHAARMMGGVLSYPALVGVLNGCSAKSSADFHPVFFSDAQGALVAELSEIMIPRTSTPGAKDVGVPAFIDSMLKDVYAPVDQQRFLLGMAEFERAAKQAYGRSFMNMDGAQRSVLVHGIHDTAVADELKSRAANAPVHRAFILGVKELTMLGFFTSEIGATQVLQYVAVPGSYRGCIAVSQAGNGKTWAHETSGAF